MDQPQIVVSDQAFYLLLIGSLVPLGGYVFNKYAPWNSETLKGIFQVILQAIAGYLYTVLATDVHGFVNISQGAFTAVVAGLFSHNILWKPANVNVKLGATPSPMQTPDPQAGVPAAAAQLGRGRAAG
jgi:hypothetical protein